MITLIPVVEADLPVLNELYEQAVNFFSFDEDSTPTPPADCLADGDLPPGNLPPGGTRDHFLIQSVVKDGHIVGYITYYKGYPAADAAYIDLLLIDEKERGNGSSGEVVRRLLDALKSEDFHSVRCAVSLKNPHAMRFWYRMGFDRVTAVDIRAHDAGVELQKTIE